MPGIRLAEAGLVPDPIVRVGIRRMLARRLREVTQPGCEQAREANARFLETLRRGPVAAVPQLANEQHYEVAPAFFQEVLGPRLKYSCGLWPERGGTLDVAEEAMLALTCERADLHDGMTVLDLGCGWGSLSLWIAERFPRCRVLAVSNSKLQGEFIRARAAERGLDRLEVRTADVNTFEPEDRFDRVISVEMFEHVRNHELLLARIARWLAPDGRLFVHHFAHREYAYPYEVKDDDDWMARHFFSGGIMPSDDLLLYVQRDLAVERHWRVGGRHYQRTAEAWLQRLDARHERVLPTLAEVYGPDAAALWLRRWRLFFLACAELFGFRGGNEWWVTHVRLAPRSGDTR